MQLHMKRHEGVTGMFKQRPQYHLTAKVELSDEEQEAYEGHRKVLKNKLLFITNKESLRTESNPDGEKYFVVSDFLKYGFSDLSEDLSQIAEWEQAIKEGCAALKDELEQYMGGGDKEEVVEF